METPIEPTADPEWDAPRPVAENRPRDDSNNIDRRDPELTAVQRARAAAVEAERLVREQFAAKYNALVKETGVAIQPFVIPRLTQDGIIRIEVQMVVGTVKPPLSE